MASSVSLDHSCQSSLRSPIPKLQTKAPIHHTVLSIRWAEAIRFSLLIEKWFLLNPLPINCSRSVVLLSTGDVAFPGIRPCLVPFFSPSWVKSLYIVLQLDMVLPMKQFVAKPTGFRSHEKAREQCSNKLHTHNMKTKNRWPGKKKKSASSDTLKKKGDVAALEDVILVEPCPQPFTPWTMKSSRGHVIGCWTCLGITSGLHHAKNVRVTMQLEIPKKTNCLRPTLFTLAWSNEFWCGRGKRGALGGQRAWDHDK